MVSERESEHYIFTYIQLSEMLCSVPSKLADTKAKKVEGFIRGKG